MPFCAYAIVFRVMSKLRRVAADARMPVGLVDSMFSRIVELSLFGCVMYIPETLINSIQDHSIRYLP